MVGMDLPNMQSTLIGERARHYQALVMKIGDICYIHIVCETSLNGMGIT